MRQRVQPRTLFTGLALLCLLAIWLSLALGPVSLPLFDTLRAGLRLIGVPISGAGLEQAEMILGQIRLPRTLLGLAVGAVLALSGWPCRGCSATRWPIRAGGGRQPAPRWGQRWPLLAAPGLAACRSGFAPYLLSFCAFVGGLGVTALVYRLGRRDGQTNVATMLLAGVAMTALGARPWGCSPTWPMTPPCAR
jgi:iron complex transport system permease protein